MNTQDPILAAAVPHVQPLQALTQPFGTHFADTFCYFRSAQPNLATIRTDGKRISFQRGLHKTNIVEDINFLRACIRAEPTGPFTEVTGEDIERAEEILDPAAAMEKRLRAKILAELEAAGISIAVLAGQVETQDSEEDLLKAAEAVTKTHIDGNLIAGVDASAAARARLAALITGKSGDVTAAEAAVITPLTGHAVPLLTPVSSSDLAGVSAGSTSSVTTSVK